LIGRHRGTLQEWLRIYREEGLAGLEIVKSSNGGGNRVIPKWAEFALSKRLQESENGFASYGAVQEWLSQTLGVEAEYHAVYQMTRYRLKANFLQFSHVDTECFQRFLNEFSQAYPDSLNIIQLDNGRFHSGKKLVLPDNIILLFQPPYCPELNPIEHLWQYLKADLRWADFKTLEELQIKLGQLLAELTPEIIASITRYPFILDALSVINTI
jgi:transposase